ncbi:MAG: hypothetical protein FJZ92_10650 [Chloroflexi bacterium]|nr:hypothetical protein [Chloroflexota bacterium]
MSDTDVINCQQVVFAEDDCCRDGVCETPATWLHDESGTALCDQHRENARKWSSGGLWRVGTRDVSYPEGWRRIGESAAAAALTGAGIERVEVGGAFTIERDPLGRP